MFYTPIPSIKPCSTHVNPKICVFSPFLAFFALERQNYPPPAEKTATEAHRRPELPPPRRRARLRALPPSPRRVRLTAHTRAEIIAGDGGRALVPRACGAVGCARGARPCIPAVFSVCLPASGRARSACRAVCAVRALRRASPPSSGGQVRALKGFSILQREHRGTGTRLRRSDRRLTAAIWPKPRKKAPALTKSGGIGRFPTPKRPAERPKMGYGVPRSVRYGSIVPSLTA